MKRNFQTIGPWALQTGSLPFFDQYTITNNAADHGSLGQNCSALTTSANAAQERARFDPAGKDIESIPPSSTETESLLLEGVKHETILIEFAEVEIAAVEFNSICRKL